MVTTKETLLHMHERIVYELEIRKELFSRAECSNLDEYNRKTGSMHPRIIVACDEVAEVLDKTGLEKSEKEQVAQIENKLSVIARQGRAFGIHLILATQRPDANILSGQIRNNIDCRACGHADNVLSQIILDNTDASSRIPKDVQGRFLLHDGTVFQGYLFDEEKRSGVGPMGCEQKTHEYNVQGKTFIVTPVYSQEGGQKMSDILLNWMCEDTRKYEDENVKKP